jgi:hypothetical protein
VPKFIKNNVVDFPVPVCSFHFVFVVTANGYRIVNHYGSVHTELSRRMYSGELS